MSESDTEEPGGIPRGNQDEGTPAEQLRRPGEVQQLDAAEKIGRGLGKAFKMFKKTRVYQRNARAFHEGLEGKE